MKLFKVIGFLEKDKPVFCRESDLELFKCKCGGKFKITKTAKDNFGMFTEHIITRQTCGGFYVANEVPLD